MIEDISSKQRFSSRLGLLLSTLGIAVGTGNIWRFPRIAAQSGSDEGAGALIIAWICFLFIWSIPLIITEYITGRKHRAGVVGSFIKGMGKRFAWMGGFVAFVATAISFFYAVIIGWSLFYLYRSLFYDLPTDNSASLQVWENFQSGGWPFVLHVVVIIIGALSISKGVRSIEKVNKFLIPVLIIIILISVFRSLALPGSAAGIRYLFKPDLSQLKSPEIWLQALTQNAWDTGAGWGLFLTYATYMQRSQGTVKNAFITGIGNNTISLLMAIMIFGTVFSVMQKGMGYTDPEVLEVMKTSGPASTGLTFIWMPQLFARMNFGQAFAVIFFLGLAFAGFSSLISMLEMTTRVVVDRGVRRRKALLLVVGVVYLMGIPSAKSLNFLSNQDFVWGLGLMISGAFIAINAVAYGLKRLRTEPGFPFERWKAGLLWEFLIRYFVPFAVLALLIWWMWLSVTIFAPDQWYDPFNPFSLMSVLLQWLIVMAGLYLFNSKLSTTK